MVLSRELPECLKALLHVSRVGSNIWVELPKMCLEVFPILGLVARQHLPEALQGVWDIVQDSLNLLFLSEPKAISEFLIFVQEVREDFMLST